MRIVPVAALICSALLLQGCIGAALVGSAAVATKAASDPRSVGTQVDDGTLEARVSGQLNKDKDIKQQRIIPVAYQGKVLLIGQAEDLSLARRAKEIAAKVDGTELVYN
ncbi:BON domain-containing protein, partial [Klebsiella pneumoniae]